MECCRIKVVLVVEEVVEAMEVVVVKVVRAGAVEEDSSSRRLI